MSRSNNDALITITAIASDIASLHGIPTNAGVHTLGSFIKTKADQARDILLKKISSNKISAFDAADDDEFINIVYLYMQAAIKGAAKENLQLLACVISEQINSQRPIYANQYLTKQNILQDLSYEQIVLLGHYIRIMKKFGITKTAQILGGKVYDELKLTLVPNFFQDFSEIESFMALTASMGLFIAYPVLGGISFVPSSFLYKLSDIDFESIISDENRN